MTRNFWFGTQPKFQRCFWFHLCQSTMPMSYRCVSVSSVSDQICACCAVGRGRGKPDLVSRITSMATFREAWPIGNWVCFQNLWVHWLCVHAHEDAEKQQAHFCILTLKCDIWGHFFLVLWTLDHIDFCSNYRFSSQKGLSERINQMIWWGTPPPLKINILPRNESSIGWIPFHICGPSKNMTKEKIS